MTHTSNVQAYLLVFTFFLSDSNSWIAFNCLFHLNTSITVITTIGITILLSKQSFSKRTPFLFEYAKKIFNLVGVVFFNFDHEIPNKYSKIICYLELKCRFPLTVLAYSYIHEDVVI